MGTACSNFEQTIYSNDCNTDVIYGVYRGFCTIDTVDGESKRDNYCAAIGDSEWTTDTSTPHGRHDTCHFNSCNQTQKMSTSAGCCQGCCAIAGVSVQCNRVAYRGDKLTCCFRDSVCNGGNTCYDNNDAGRSCDPAYRDLSNSNCRELAFNMCTNADAQHPEWRAYWLTTNPLSNAAGTGTSQYLPQRPPCIEALWRNVYGTNSSGCQKSDLGFTGGQVVLATQVDGFIWGRKLIEAMLRRYLSEGGTIISDIATDGDTSMNDLIWNLCSNNPGLCQNMLFSVCSTVTTFDIERNPGLQKWCGCYLPELEYAKYTNLYQINRECTPVCNAQGNIGVLANDGLNTLRCQQNTCVIDDVSIRLYRSRIGVGSGGGINFSQVCGSCGDNAVCSCTLTGINLTAVEATIPEINISQNCGDTSICYAEVESPTTGRKALSRQSCTTAIDDFVASKSDELQRLDDWRILKSFGVIAGVIFGCVLLWKLINPYPREGSVIYPRARSAVNFTQRPETLSSRAPLLADFEVIDDNYI